ncbi:MAG: hypothetical protein JNJ45_06200 [Chthonomonas sp.]|nr:hypothetical protein [Chthonomonas sp.]
MRVRALVGLVGIALVGCGGSDSPNPFNGTSINNAAGERDAGRASGEAATPVPVFLTVDPAKTSSSAVLTLKKVSLARSGDSDTLTESANISFWARGLIAEKEGKVVARKFIYLGNAPRNRGYIRASITLAPEFYATALGETAAKQQTLSTPNLSVNLEATKMIADALVLELSVDETAKTAALAIGKADGVNEPQNMQPGFILARMTPVKGEGDAIRLSSSTLGVVAIEKDRWLGTPLAGAAAQMTWLGGVYNPATKRFESAVAGSVPQKVLASPDRVVGTDPTLLGPNAKADDNWTALTRGADKLLKVLKSVPAKVDAAKTEAAKAEKK